MIFSTHVFLVGVIVGAFAMMLWMAPPEGDK